MSVLLQVLDLTVDYGPVRALHDVSLEVRESEIVAILGANGAGKSTLLRAISGLVAPSGGDVRFLDQSLLPVAARAERIAKLGIAHVPEGRQVFPELTVTENLLIATAARTGTKGIDEDIERIETLFPVLAERRQQHGWSLSGGEQQMLVIGRALMARPRLLMLDEPSLGLAPIVAREVLRTIQLLRSEGTTVLLVEQNARAALRIADRAYILENGHLTIHGSTTELRRSDRVREAYLGIS
jgi:branched-chain amino acid transport system ATP-binding protein